MADDDTTQRHGQDRTRIDIHEEHELRYRTKELGIDEETLKDTAGQFGNQVKNVDLISAACSTPIALNISLCIAAVAFNPY